MQDQEFADLKRDIQENGLLEEIWLHPDGRIIDGRNRYMACVDLGIRPEYRTWNDDEGSLVLFVLSLNLHRRHLTSGQKAAIALEIEPMLAEEAEERMKAGGGDKKSETYQKSGKEIFPYPIENKGQARDQAAAAVGTNGRYVSDLKKVKKQAPELVNDVKNGTYTIPDAKLLLKVSEPERQQVKVKLEAGETSSVKSAIRKVQQESRLETIKPVDADWLIVGDLCEVGTQIPDESIDLIFTDPPYDAGAINLYGALAELAKRVLKPSGILVAYSGQMHLPQIMTLMGEHLDYMWMCGIGHSGGSTWFRKWNLNNQWKPLLMYGKPPIVTYWNRFDDFISGGREKDHHEWQQSLAEAKHYIEALCPPGGAVLDPFLGSGTTLVAAKQLDRQYFGIEIDEVTGRAAQERIVNVSA